ncbi:MAG: hypothetical protein OXL41_11475 [Nitrospinae bacterium]|nr:hypothetical protein [Nitrospinota bacterium]
MRDETRRTLLSFLPKHSRQLLYRLSFIIGKFNRQLAIELGQTLSVIPLSGESFDALVGSLVEVLGLDVYRISPLASNFGREILAQGDQRIVHRSIASHMTSKRTINALDVDVIVLHSLLGNYSKGLAIAALGILSASTDNIEQYAEYMPTLRLLKTNAPLQIEDKYVSALIRLAQFKLTVAHGDVDRASDIADRIFDELARVPEGEAKSVLESTVVLTILCNVGVANILDNWVHLLVRAKDILNGEVFRNFVKPRTQDKFDPSDLCHLGALFGIGAANIQSVSRLEGIIDDLDYVETTARREMLSPLDSSLDDHSGFIGASWVAELEAGTLNADEAALRYGRMAAKTQTWDLPLLSSQCSIAQSVMLDEYLHDGDSALSVLHEAQVALGPQAPLVHALVKIHWRNGKYDSALQLFSESECLPRLANPVDAAFAFRIGAICAARCAEWVRAEKWFHTAQNHATLADTDEMTVMAVGLGADAAICAFKANDTERAILGLIRSVEALVTMNADQSVRSAYCHRVIRHALLWVNAQIQCTEMLDSDGFPLVMEVGMCSNPQPPPAVVEQPLSSLDIAWYMLAEIEVGTRLNLGINTGLDRHITGGPIPLMDASLRIRKFQNYIDQLDVDKFVTNFMEYIEGAHYVLTAMSNVEAQKKPLDSVRGMVPAIDLQGPLDYHVGRIGKNAVICYALQSVFEGSVSSISELNYALSVAFSGSFPGHQVLEYWSGQNGELEELERTVIGLVKKNLEHEHIEPRDFFISGLKFFEWSNQSIYKDFLAMRISKWQRVGWRRILATQSFFLVRPRQYVPRIAEVLAIPSDDRKYLAKLFLVTAEAVRVSLGSEYRNYLKSIAEDGS